MILFLALLVGAAVAAPHPGKIVGGEDTDITEVPYQLSLEENELLFWSHICGASIVGPNAVVTAGHCADGQRPGAIRFRAGTSRRGEGGTIHHADTITVHPQYDYVIADYDIAFVTVKKPFDFTESVQAIPLATSEPQDGDVALISGWGVEHEGGLFPPAQLQSVSIPIVDRATCQEEYNDPDDPYTVTERMICAGVPEGGKDSCQGDSGGPLVVNGTLSGVVSWGLGCARAGKPGVYTNVAALSDWVNEQLQKLK